MHTNKIVNGEQIPLTQEEIAEIEAREAAYIPPAQPVMPTKEELLSQLETLQSQINQLPDV